MEILSEQHLRRLICDYVSYDHQVRIHDSLEVDAPNRRLVENKLLPNSAVTSRLFGLHLRYARRDAA